MSFAATVDADILGDALAPVAALVDECKVHLNGDGLEIRAVDPANVAMIDLSADAGAFARYEGGDAIDVLGINLEQVQNVLSMADSDDMVTLELDEETRKLSIRIGGLDYTLALIDPESIREEPDLPDLDLPGVFVLEGRELSRAITAADLCSDHLKIVGEDGRVRFEAEGDTDDVQVTLGDGRLLSARLDDSDPVASLFSLDYLQDMRGPIPDDCEVSLLVGDEFPTKLRYSLADGNVSVTNMLAPRIQNQ